jgi:hypothetical protein
MTENSRDTQARQYNPAETGKLAHLYRGEMSRALISRGAFTDAFAPLSARAIRITNPATSLCTICCRAASKVRSCR